MPRAVKRPHCAPALVLSPGASSSMGLPGGRHRHPRAHRGRHRARPRRRPVHDLDDLRARQQGSRGRTRRSPGNPPRESCRPGAAASQRGRTTAWHATTVARKSPAHCIRNRRRPGRQSPCLHDDRGVSQGKACTMGHRSATGRRGPPRRRRPGARVARARSRQM